MREKRIPALLNEKDVTTDWIDSVFDSPNLIYDTRKVVGFIKGCVVMASWSYNVVTWHVSKEFGGDHVSAFLILEERLKAWESEEQNVYSDIEHEGCSRYVLTQTFYFRDEE